MNLDDPRWQPAVETAALALVCGVAWLAWPKAWDDMAGLLILCTSLPCCLIHVPIYVFYEVLLLVFLVRSWAYAIIEGPVNLGLILFTISLAIGFIHYQVNRNDPTEYPPQPYLNTAYFMLLGAALCTAELRIRRRPTRKVSLTLWLSLPVFLTRPTADIMFAGV